MTEKGKLDKQPAMYNLPVAQLANDSLPEKPASELKLFFDDKATGDLGIAVTWGSE